jgi:hypothetical protein
LGLLNRAQHVPLHGTASARAAAAAIDAFHIGGGEEPSRRRTRDLSLSQQQRSAVARRRMSLDNSALDFGSDRWTPCCSFAHQAYFHQPTNTCSSMHHSALLQPFAATLGTQVWQC